MTSETPGEPFTAEQTSYLQGFVSGYEARRASQGLPTFAALLGRAGGATPSPGEAGDPPARPERVHRQAQDRFLAQGKKLTPEEEAKRKVEPLDLWDELARHATEDRFPRGTDVFLFKFHGLFYVAPAQDAFMCRLRIPAGILSSHQVRCLAAVAERWCGGYADVTSRANLQLREIKPRDALSVLTSIQDLGLHTRGAGADNIRNITATPTSGIDPQELIDTAPLARELHHYILNHRELYGLPRKFNVAFDGGGTISALEDTNDIGFAAVRVGPGKQVPPGVYFRVALGGITGHRDLARDAGLCLEPRECVPLAAAMVRVFIDHGDRTDRKKARLKYLLDAWGHEKFLEETQRRLPFGLRRLPLADCEPRGPAVKHAHVGVHPQKQEGLCYAGVVLPVGRMTAAQMRGLAAIADRHGSGTLRLTVWQNLLLSDIPGERTGDVRRELREIGLAADASNIAGCLVACTGSKGCKYAAADTKGHALEIARHLDARLELDQPLNIHLTGCPHSCAQHYIGDIGLLGTRVQVGEDMVEGYHIFAGGGYGTDGGMGREIERDVPAAALGEALERLLRTYQSERQDQESFREFVCRLPASRLRAALAAGGQPPAPLEREHSHAH